MSETEVELEKIPVCLEVQVSLLGLADLWMETEVELEKISAYFEVQASFLGPEDLEMEVDSQETGVGHVPAE